MFHRTVWRYLLILLAILGSLTIFPNPAAFGADAKAVNVYERGRFEYDDGNYLEALKYFEWAIRLDRSRIQFYIARGQALFKLQRYQDAEVQFKALVNHSDAARKAMYVELGALYGHLKRYPEAIEQYSLAIGAFPQRADLYLARGVMYMEKGEYASAESDFQQAGRMKPELASAVEYHRALLSFRQEDYDTTFIRIDSAFSKKPDAALAKSLAEFQSVVKGEARAYKDWNITVTASYIYDDNVNLEPKLSDTLRSHLTDESFAYTLAGTYYLYNDRSGNLGFFYRFADQNYDRFSQVDVQSHTTGAFWAANRDPLYYRIQADVGYYYSDRLDYMTRWSISPSLAWLLTAKDRLAFTGLLERKARHDGGDSGNRYVFNTTYYTTFVPARDTESIGFIGRLGMQWEYEDPDDDAGLVVPAARYQVWEIQTGLSFPLPMKLEGDLGLAYARTQYEENPLKWGGQSRQDTRIMATAKLGRKINDYLRAEFLYTYTYNNSNLRQGSSSPYDFNRNVYTLTLTGSF